MKPKRSFLLKKIQILWIKANLLIEKLEIINELSSRMASNLILSKQYKIIKKEFPDIIRYEEEQKNIYREVLNEIFTVYDSKRRSHYHLIKDNYLFQIRDYELLESIIEEIKSYIKFIRLYHITILKRLSAKFYLFFLAKRYSIEDDLLKVDISLDNNNIFDVYPDISIRAVSVFNNFAYATGRAKVVELESSADVAEDIELKKIYLKRVINLEMLLLKFEKKDYSLKDPVEEIFRKYKIAHNILKIVNDEREIENYYRKFLSCQSSDVVDRVRDIINMQINPIFN